MTATPDATSIPVSWLKPMPEDYRLPIWRWVLLPATALMLKHNGGVWISGTLTLGETDLSFVQVKAIPLAKGPVESWSIPLGDLKSIAVTPKLASETIAFEHSGGTHKILGVRSAPFLARIRQRTGL